MDDSPQILNIGTPLNGVMDDVDYEFYYTIIDPVQRAEFVV